MPISTIKESRNTLKTILIYVLGVTGIGLVVFFGGEILKNIDNIKGKSALSVKVLDGTADVLINNQPVGKTPFESTTIKPGENKITIKNESTQYETSINFLPNSKNYIHNVGIFRDLGISDIFSSGQEFWFEKDKSGNAVRILSQPSGASVYIDGTEIGKTPFSSNALSEDSYDLRVEYPGYEAQTARINVKKGYTLDVNMTLFPLPVPSKVTTFEDSQGLYNGASDNSYVTSDTAAWVKVVIYWNRTRGINIDGSGLIKEPVFDYFLDYKGNIYNKAGTLLTTTEDFASLKDAQKGLYLGRVSDGTGLTKEAKDALTNLAGAGGLGKKATVKETGTGWLRVRDSASLNGKEVGRVDVGKVYGVLEETTGWVKIKVSDTLSGWVSADYVTVQ